MNHSVTLLVPGKIFKIMAVLQILLFQTNKLLFQTNLNLPNRSAIP